MISTMWAEIEKKMIEVHKFEQPRWQKMIIEKMRKAGQDEKHYAQVLGEMRRQNKARCQRHL